jgi:hypothetical protein
MAMGLMREYSWSNSSQSMQAGSHAGKTRYFPALDELRPFLQ